MKLQDLATYNVTCPFHLGHSPLVSGVLGGKTRKLRVGVPLVAAAASAVASWYDFLGLDDDLYSRKH